VAPPVSTPLPKGVWATIADAGAFFLLYLSWISLILLPLASLVAWVFLWQPEVLAGLAMLPVGVIARFLGRGILQQRRLRTRVTGVLALLYGTLMLFGAVVLALADDSGRQGALSTIPYAVLSIVFGLALLRVRLSKQTSDL
jgi:hypothetical protein